MKAKNFRLAKLKAMAGSKLAGTFLCSNDYVAAKKIKKLSDRGCTLLLEVVVLRVSRPPEPIAAHPR
jgi:predicted dinucleotide-binding enzyme